MKKLLEFKTFIFVEAVLFVLYFISGALRPVSIELPGTAHSPEGNLYVTALVWIGLIVTMLFIFYLLVFIVGRIVMYLKKSNI